MPKRTTHDPLPPKFRRPLFEATLPRPRLLGLLGAPGKPVVWVSGPPGSGKTTAVSQFLAHASRPYLWCSLDHSDGDVSTFFFRLAQAVNAMAGPVRRRPLAAPASGFKGDLAVFAQRFFAELFARVPPGFTLVLDNAQDALSEDSALSSALASAWQSRAGNARLVVVSRESPGDAWSALVTADCMALVVWDHLRFTRDEVLACARLHGLAEEEGAAIAARSAGLAAVAALLCAVGQPLAAGPQAQASDALLKSVAAGLLDWLPAGDREILLELAIAPELSPALVRALRPGDDRAPALLAELHRQNIFISRVEGSVRGTSRYRLHPLFRELLGDRALAQLPEARLRALRLICADRLVAESQDDLAVPLLMDAGLFDRAADHLTSMAQRLIREGRAATLARLGRSLPAGQLASRPWLQFWVGCALAVLGERKGLNSDALALLNAAHAAFAATRERTGELLGAARILLLIDFTMPRQIDPDPWVDAIRTASVDPATFADADQELIAVAGSLLVGVRVDPAWDQLPAVAARAIALLAQDSDPNLRLEVARLLVTWMEQTGQRDRELEIRTAATRLLDNPATSPAACAEWHVIWAQYCGHFGAWPASAAALEAAEAIAQLHGDMVTLRKVHLSRALHCLSDADYDGARTALDRYERWADASAVVDLVDFHYRKAWLAIAQGSLQQGREEAMAAIEVAQSSGWFGDPIVATLRSMVAMADLAGDRGDEAARTLERCRDVSPEGHRPIFQILLDLTLAHEVLRDDPATARRLLEKGLRAAREEAWPQFLRALPAHTARLCAAALEWGIEPAFVTSVVRARRLSPPSRETPHWPWPVRIESLGTFGLEVEGESPTFPGKAQRRPLELLKGIVAGGGQQVDSQQLSYALWPNAGVGDPRNVLEVTLSRLRKILRADQAIRLQDGMLSLNPDAVWLDLRAFDQAAGVAEAALAAAPASRGDGIDSACRRALGLYRGALFAEALPEFGVPLRERMGQLFARLVSRYGEWLERERRFDGAIALYESALERQGLVEAYYRGIIRAQLAQGRQREASLAFQRCRDALTRAGRPAPSQETALLAQQAAAD